MNNDEAIRLRIVSRATPIVTELVTRFTLAQNDLQSGQHRAAIGALDGVDTLIDNLRCLLRLLEP
jgi:hypothetical protein